LAREAVDDTLVELRTDRRIHVGIAVAEHDRQQTTNEVDIFVAVDVPDTPAAPVAEEQRRLPFRILDVALAEGLRAERDHLLRTREHGVRAPIAIAIIRIAHPINSGVAARRVAADCLAASAMARHLAPPRASRRSSSPACGSRKRCIRSAYGA